MKKYEYVNPINKQGNPWEMMIQLHKGSSTTNVQSYTPTEGEKRLQNAAADYAEYVAPNARWLNDTAYDVLNNSIGAVQVDFNSMNNAAQQQIASAQQGVQNLANGQIPAAYQTAMEDSIRSGVQNTMGQQLNSLAGRGVLNSSVTNQAMNDISKNASNAMAEQYSNNISTLNGLYGQQSSLANAGITTGAAAQEAAQTPALNLWNASLGLNGANTSALSAVAGQGTTTSTSTTSGSGGWLGGLVGLGSSAISAFCFAKGTKIGCQGKDKNIEDIKAGDSVLQLDESGDWVSEETVLAVVKSHIADTYRIVTEETNGTIRRLVCTLSQPLQDAGGNFVEVSMIKINTPLRLVGKVVAIEYAGKQEVYDIKVSGNNTYFANGFVAMGADDKELA